jgi:two-component system, NarL family, sensor kinase
MTGGPGHTTSSSGPPRFATGVASRRSRRTWAGLEILAFVVVPLLVLVAVAATTVLLSERIARANAVADAEGIATRFVRLLVTPRLGDALAGDTRRWQELETIVMQRLSDGSITFLVVWSPTGEIRFASVDAAVGQRHEPSPELLAAAEGRVVSSVDEEPEESYQGPADGPMVEVYVPTTANGETLVVEAYFAYDGIEEQAALLRGELIPLAVGALVVLEMVQLPIATALARRVRRQETERAELMRLSLTASERERRSLAADVHDGPVQELAGVSYALGALRTSLPEDRRPDADRLIAALRRAVHSLRRLMVDLYPPDLSGAGLPDALEDLAAPLRAQGVAVTVHAAPVPDLGRDNAVVLYRTAKEALTNIAKHASATHVWISLGPTDDGPGSAARLDIDDDGVGFPAAGTDRLDGHLGLRLVADRIRDAGGTLELRDRAEGGASLSAVVPGAPGA